MEQLKKEKVAYDYCAIGTNILGKIREELIIPFLKSSKQTKKCGIIIDEKDRVSFKGNLNDDGEMSFFSYTNDGEFPLSMKKIGTELESCIKVTRFAIVYDEKVINRCEAIAEIVRCETDNPDAVPDLFQNWTRDCLRYLRAMTENPLRALSMLMEDRHPYVLYSAIMALNLLYNESPEFSKSLLLCVSGLIKLYEDTHKE